MIKQSSKPVRSAEAVAALRAVSAREPDRTVSNPDYLAERFITGFYAALLALPHSVSRRLIEKITPGSYCYFLVRTKFIDEYLLQAVDNKVRQVVILGSGYDSRAYRFQPKLAGVKVYEIDLPSTQQAKLKRLERGHVPGNRNVVYVATDFNGRPLRTELENHGFDFNKPTFFVWEGVSYFLKENSVREILRFVSQDCAKGSSIVFDYALKSFVDGVNGTYGAKQVQKWLAKNNERFEFGLDEGEMERYLKSFGFLVTEDIGPTDFGPRYLQRSNGQSIGRPFGHLRMAHCYSA